MDKYTEKRKYARFDTDITAGYRKLKDDPAKRTGIFMIVDIGEGGIRFIAEDFIPMSSRFVIELNVPLIEEPIKIIAKVAWMQKKETGGNFEVGSQFLEMKKRDKTILGRYMHALSLQ